MTFGGPPQENLEYKKTSKIRRDFWKLSTLIADVAATDRRNENPKSTLSTNTTSHPLLGEKFGKLWLNNKKL